MLSLKLKCWATRLKQRLIRTLKSLEKVIREKKLSPRAQRLLEVTQPLKLHNLKMHVRLTATSITTTRTFASELLMTQGKEQKSDILLAQMVSAWMEQQQLRSWCLAPTGRGHTRFTEHDLTSMANPSRGRMWPPSRHSGLPD